MRPQQRRERAKRVLRARILARARTLFAREGYERVTMRRLAAAIGYSATAIYLHFPDKLALLQEICNQDFAALRTGFAGAEGIADPVERIRAIGRGYAAFAGRHPHQYRLMFMNRLEAAEAARLAAGCAIEQGNPTQDGYALLVRTVEAAIATGRLRPPFREAHLAAQTLWAGLHGVIALHLDKATDPWVPWRGFDERIAAMIDALIDGMALPVGKPSKPAQRGTR